MVTLNDHAMLVLQRYDVVVVIDQVVNALGNRWQQVQGSMLRN